MFSRGRQRMGEQARFLSDSRISVVILKTVVRGWGVEVRGIEPATGPQADFLFGVEFDKRSASRPPIVVERCFLCVIVQTALPFQSDLDLVAKPESSAGGK